MSEQAQVEKEVLLSHHTSPSGKISIITLNRPAKYNALSGPHYRYLAHLMHTVHNDLETIATVIIGTGSFFSAGADITAVSSIASILDDTEDSRSAWISSFARLNLNITTQFSQHRHPLFICLNGPVIGLSASLVAFADFIFAVNSTYLLTPFASLGLAPEGGASLMFPLKMGWTLANRALMLSEKLTFDELMKAGFIAREVPAEGFRDACVKMIESTLEDKNIESMRIAKAHMSRLVRLQLENHNLGEVYAAADRFDAGIPQTQFMRLASKEKKHKL